MKQLSILFIFALLTGSVQLCLADSWLESQGDKEFQQLNYPEAIQFYKDAIRKKGQTGLLSEKIADCYRMVHNAEKAEEWYAQAIELEHQSDQLYYNYAMALQNNAKYKEAEEALGKYVLKNPSDTHAKKLYNEFYKLDEYKKDKGFYTIKFEEINTEHSEFSPTYYRNDKILFVSNRSEKKLALQDEWRDEDFFQAHVALIGADNDLVYSSICKMIHVNGRFHEGPMCYNPHEEKIYFTRSNYRKFKSTKGPDKLVHLKIYSRKVDEQGDGIGKLEEAFEYNSDEYSVGYPTISRDGKFMVFASDMDNSKGESDLYYTMKTEDGWSTPKRLSDKINTSKREMFPHLGPENTLYFASMGHTGLGGLDIFMAEYQEDQKWGEPANMGTPVNSSKDDFGLVLDEDGEYGFFSSNRKDTYDNDDIYGFHNIKARKCWVAGLTEDNINFQPVPNTFVKVINAQTKKPIIELSSNEFAEYKFKLAPNAKYLITGNKNDFNDGQNIFTIDDDCQIASIEKEVKNYKDILSLSEKYNIENIANVYLQPVSYLDFEGLIIDVRTGKAIQDAKVVLKDNKTGKELIVANTDASGHYRKTLQGYDVRDEIDWQIIVKHPYYINKDINHIEEIDANPYKVTTRLKRLEVGMDLAKIFEINPIYFDLDKYNIRPDAAEELDKIVSIMKDYPEMVIELGSHTDCRASYNYNITLSSNRAKSSRQYIVDHGIAPDRISGKGYGETQLTNDCKDGVICSEEEHQQNRRTEFIIVKF